MRRARSPDARPPAPHRTEGAADARLTPAQAAALALQREVGNRATRALMRDPDPPPTYGNMPRDLPESFSPRVILRFERGKWREVEAYSSRTASGSYDFVIQDGTIYAVKVTGRVGAPV